MSDPGFTQDEMDTLNMFEELIMLLGEEQDDE